MSGSDNPPSTFSSSPSSPPPTAAGAEARRYQVVAGGCGIGVVAVLLAVAFVLNQRLPPEVSRHVLDELVRERDALRADLRRLRESVPTPAASPESSGMVRIEATAREWRITAGRRSVQIDVAYIRRDPSSEPSTIGPIAAVARPIGQFTLTPGHLLRIPNDGPAQLLAVASGVDADAAAESGAGPLVWEWPIERSPVQLITGWHDGDARLEITLALDAPTLLRDSPRLPLLFPLGLK